MSNILVIKHGSLGDISQISGVLKDIKETYNDKKIFILTTLPYVELLSKCPYINGVLIDKRLPRWNILYLIKLKKLLGKFDFSYVYDLQNSPRTSFYRRFLLNITNWSSAETILKKGEKKGDFDNESVLERFKIQLEHSNVKTNNTLKPDFSWAADNVDKIVNKYMDLIETIIKKGIKDRLTGSIELALKVGNGLVIIDEIGQKEHLYNEYFSCPKCDISFEELQPRAFSFNSPFGACNTCDGLGTKIIDILLKEKLIIETTLKFY